MSGQDILESVVSVWALAMAASPGLQIRRMLQTGDSRDVSIGYFAVLTVGFLLWVAYGISVDDYIVAVPNAVAFVFGLATMLLALRLRRSVGPAADRGSER